MTTNSDTPHSSTNQISIFDIYEFFLKNLKTIALWVIAAVCIGAIVAFSLPVKYEASAAIDTARVGVIASLTNQNTDFELVEPKELLAEKLKLPTYYSENTIKSCGFADETNPRLALTKEISSSIARNSNFVTVNFQAETPALATACLDTVLANIISQQNKLAAPKIERLKIALQTLTQQFDNAKTEQKQLLTYNREKLAVANTKLEANQAFVDQFSKDALSFKFDNQQFSASALLLNTLVSKQNDIKQLELDISRLQFEVNGSITAKDNEVLELSKKLDDLKNAMKEPLTKQASFATPVYAPDQKVEPKRAIIMIFSLFAGFALSIIFLLGRSALRHAKAQASKTTS
jgi:LPS O-antigen subunit length determinant protein (WzzB/FepE family)